MARTIIHEIIGSKMDILMKQRNHFQTFVDETNEVLQLATSWLRNEDTTKSFTFSAMNKMMEDKLTYLMNTNFFVGSEEAATEDESFPSAPNSTDQPLPAHVHVSGVTVASDELKTISSQVNVMQDAMSFISTSSKMLSEKQLAMEKLVESLSDKYSKVEQEKLREIERELEGIKNKHKKAVIQQDKRMTSFEKKIQAVTDSQSDIIENCHQQQIKIKDQKKETEKLKTQSQQFTKDLRDALDNVQELDAEIGVVEKKTATNTQMGALEGEIESLKESLDKLSTKLEEHGSSIVEFTGNNALSSAQKCESEKLQKLEEKLSALENSWNVTTVENGKLCQDVETKVVTDRLVPLERLRDIFNGKLHDRTGHIKKLDDVCDQKPEFIPKFSQAEQQTQRQAIGFSATSHTFRGLYKNHQTLFFPNVRYNFGAHFNSKTGEFTAPMDGLYAAFFSADIEEGDYPIFSIIKKPCSCKITCIKCVCIATTQFYGLTHASAFGLVDIKASDKLIVKCHGVDEKKHLTTYFQLTCFKIC